MPGEDQTDWLNYVIYNPDDKILDMHMKELITSSQGEVECILNVVSSKTIEVEDEGGVTT